MRFKPTYLNKTFPETAPLYQFIDECQNNNETAYIARNHCNLTQSQLENFSKEIRDKFNGRTTIVEYYADTRGGEYIEIEDGYIYLDPNARDSGEPSWIASTDKTKVEWFKNRLTEISTELAEKESKLYCLVNNGGNLYLQDFKLVSQPLVLDNYHEHLTSQVEHLCAEITSKNPCGKLTIISGEPGTGKTFLIKGIIEKIPDCVCVFLPANSIESIASPQLIPVFFNSVLKDKTTVLILEDADICLATRDGSNTSLVSTLLNATDGLLGDILNLRIIATTNVHKADIDPAIVRAGRLCQFMTVGKLSPERCVKVFKRLQPDKPVPEFNSPRVLAEIYREIKGAPPLDLPEEEPLGFK